jgi:hypothetical protein
MSWDYKAKEELAELLLCSRDIEDMDEALTGATLDLQQAAKDLEYNEIKARGGERSEIGKYQVSVLNILKVLIEEFGADHLIKLVRRLDSEGHS